jgi:hypothetical protein
LFLIFSFGLFFWFHDCLLTHKYYLSERDDDIGRKKMTKFSYNKENLTLGKSFSQSIYKMRKMQISVCIYCHYFLSMLHVVNLLFMKSTRKNLENIIQKYR